MRRTIFAAVVVCCLGTGMVQAQDVGMPGVMYSGSIAAGTGGQLYPFDRQDPWLHGHYQRVPAYGGFASFRPYNYRHVYSQTQISSSVWGSAHGLPYSQQFWNRYRSDYLNGNVHSQAAAAPAVAAPVSPVGFQTTAPVVRPQSQPSRSAGQPIHVYPPGVSLN